jgi:DNA-binding LytR/AlgR family response regulator
MRACMSTFRSCTGDWKTSNESIGKTARAFRGQKPIAPEDSFRQALHDAVIPASTHRGEMIAATDFPAQGILKAAQKGAQAVLAVTEIARIAIKANGRVLFVDTIDIIAARAEGNYLALLHKSGCYLVRETMATAEKKLAPLGFLRIHRSKLVNSKLVKDLRRDKAGTYLLRTNDGSEHSVGRAYKDNLKMIASSWLGVDLLLST